jgi:hypothetical protein
MKPFYGVISLLMLTIILALSIQLFVTTDQLKLAESELKDLEYELDYTKQEYLKHLKSDEEYFLTLINRAKAIDTIN